MSNKSVLLIAYHYPPFGQTSSRRSGCMAKYLPYFGWKPIVLTRKWTSTNGPYDSTIVKSIPHDVVVHEVDCDTLSRTAVGRFNKRFNKTCFPHLDPIEFFRETRKSLPDLIAKHNIQVVWATFPSLCNLSLADQVSKNTGIPWVADFRDVYQFVDGLGAVLMHQIRLFHQKRMLRSASAIIAVSDGFAETLRRRNNREVIVIPNGFDPDVVVPEKTLRFPKFELVYTGGINLGRPDFTPFLDALHYLCSCGKIDSDDVAVTFYGSGNEKRFKTLLRHPFLHAIRNCGGVSRDESLENQRAALILLQTTAPGTGWMTSKIYEYLVARRPIMAFPRDGDHIEKLLIETNAGVSCSTRDEIAAQLMEWYSEWKKTGTVAWHGDMSVIMQYSRKEQAKETAHVLEEVVRGN